jgi:ubiquinone biosynthesis protein
MFSLASIPHLARNARRFQEVARVLAKYGLAEFLSSSDSSLLRNALRGPAGTRLTALRREERLRLALSEIGGTGIKLGQILSTRPDLIGPEVAAELALLRDSAEPDPPEAIRRIITEDLGAPPELLFARFDPEPVASASIGQVHRAELTDGTEVVVKVRHAGLEDKVQADLDILMGLAALAEERARELRLYQPVAVAGEIRRTILREMNFVREARNLGHFARNFEGDPRVAFPKTYPELCSRRVLTMESLVGRSIADIESAAATPEETERRKRLSQNTADIFLEMIFRDNFFHADPHPGNIVILPGDRLGLIDCGMVGRLDDRSRRAMEEALLAIVDGDAANLTEQVTRLGRLPPRFDRDALSLDIEDFVSDYASQSFVGFDLSGAFTDLSALVRRHGVLLPPTVAHLLKVFVLLEGASKALNPDFSLIEVIRPYAVKITARRFSPTELFGKLRRSYKDWSDLLTGFPGDIADILRRAREGSLDVNLAHKGLDATVNRLVYGLLTTALFLGSCLVMAHRVPPLAGDVSLFGALGGTVSILLGLRLMRAIRRSGDLGQRP